MEIRILCYKRKAVITREVPHLHISSPIQSIKTDVRTVSEHARKSLDQSGREIVVE